MNKNQDKEPGTINKKYMYHIYIVEMEMPLNASYSKFQTRPNYFHEINISVWSSRTTYFRLLADNHLA